MKTLIIDDERLARSELKRLLMAHPGLEIVDEANNAQMAKSLIERHQPDLLFLDIQMPGKTGFELLEELETAPFVIFTTAYDHFALRAFEVNALDYLLKPIEPERLAEAVARVLNQAQEEKQGRVEKLTESDRVFVKDGDRCWFVRLGDVALFESEGNYTRLYFSSERPLVYRSLAYLEERLDPKSFFRASRRHIINLKWVTQLEAGHNGGMVATLQGHQIVGMSRRQATRFKEQLSL